MSSRPRAVSSLAAAALAATCASFAQEAPVVALIPPSGGTYSLEAEYLPEAPLSIHEAPRHGAVRLLGDHLDYAPGPSFWALGSDTLIYQGPSRRVTVLLLRSMWPVTESSDFERLTVAAPWQVVGERVEIGNDGAVSGRGGASIAAGVTDAYLAVEVPPATPTDPNDGPSGDAGHGVATGGTIVIETMAPRSAGNLMVLYEGAPDPSAAARTRLYLRVQGTRYELVAATLVNGVVQHETSAVPLPLGPRRWSLEWWRPTAPEIPAGLRLILDEGMPRTMRVPSTPNDELGAHRFGSMAVTAMPPAVRLDNLWIRRGDLYGQDLGAASWGATVADVSAGWAWQWGRGPAWYGQGHWWPIAPPGDGGAAWHPPLEWPSASYNARLVLDVPAARLAADAALMSASWSAAPPRDVTRDLWGLRVSAERLGTSRLEAFVNGPGVAPRVIGTAVGAGRHVLEMQWRAATSATMRDGLLRLWVDGQEVGVISGIEATTPVDAVRVGTGASEAWALETFQAWY